VEVVVDVGETLEEVPSRLMPLHDVADANGESRWGVTSSLL